MSETDAKPACNICGKTKSLLPCGPCGEMTCKNCAEFVDESEFSFFRPRPAALMNTCFCGNCSQSVLAPIREQYDQMMAQARDIYVFTKRQSRETQLLKRTEEPITISECADHDEAVLRMAFIAAQMGYNGVVDIDLKSHKIQNGNYQHLVWSGTGLPVQIDPEKVLTFR